MPKLGQGAVGVKPAGKHVVKPQDTGTEKVLQVKVPVALHLRKATATQSPPLTAFKVPITRQESHKPEAVPSEVLETLEQIATAEDRYRLL